MEEDKNTKVLWYYESRVSIEVSLQLGPLNVIG